MPELKTIARPYALAVWRHAKTQGEQAAWSKMLGFMAAVVSDKAIAAILPNPRVAPDRLKQLMAAICDEHINDVASALVNLLIDNNKLVLMPDIANQFEQLQAQDSECIQAVLSTAYPLSADLEKAIAVAVQRRLGREVSFTVEVNKSLLGGVIIRAGDVIIDASMGGRIQALADQVRI